MNKLIGESLSSDLSNLERFEVFYNEGDTGELRIYLDSEVSEITIEQLQNNILAQGVILTKPIIQEARIIFIGFQKAIAPLLIIGGVVVALIGGILGWQIFKTVMAGVPIWVWLVGGGALLYLLLREPVKKAAPYAIEAGKVYITRKVGGK